MADRPATGQARSDIPPARDREKLSVLVSGASGLVGSHLRAYLGNRGDDLSRLVRRQADATRKEIAWDPGAGKIDAERLEGFDAVVNLSGENIAAGRWTDATKQRILDSRVNTTRLLAETMARLEHRPRTFVCASAVGYYGDRGDTLLTEESPSGSGFLAEVCRQWEQATDAARAAGVRVVNLRTGVVLSPGGGALAKMLPPFRMGLGGVVGSGEQWISWIAMADLVRVIEFALVREGLSGAVNAVSPSPVTNRELTKTLGRVLRRPTVVPLPSAAVRLAMGQMGEETLLASARVIPERLLAAGFQFRHPQLEEALRHELSEKTT